MKTRRDGSKATTSADRPSTDVDDPKASRRRELRAAECAKRGVRFLPAQVMRSIYEREGVL